MRLCLGQPVSATDVSDAERSARISGPPWTASSAVVVRAARRRHALRAVHAQTGLSRGKAWSECEVFIVTTVLGSERQRRRTL